MYNWLFNEYGPQGWWPVSDVSEETESKFGEEVEKIYLGIQTSANNIANTNKKNKGYHLKDYSYPKTNQQKFEICLGAILTQNTSWTSVEKALENLKKLNALNIEVITKLTDEEIKNTIKPAGYYNQKMTYIREFIKFFDSIICSQNKIPSRSELLAVKGIGPETADSMLLYAFNQPTFVVDAYTKRICLNLGLINETSTEMKYDHMQKLFETTIKQNIELINNNNNNNNNKKSRIDKNNKEQKNTKQLVVIYQEYHALIVAHAKKFYQKKEMWQNCPLKKQTKSI